MSDSLLMLAWLALAVSHGFNTVAVMWLLRRETRKVTIHWGRSVIDYRPEETQ